VKIFKEKTMQRSYWKQTAALVAIVALFLCSQAPMVGAATGDQTTAAEVRKEIGHTLQTIGSYTAEQRDAAVAKAKDALAKTDARIEQLQQTIDKHWQTMSEEARQQARQTQSDLQKQRVAIAEWYGRMQQSSAGAWEEIKKGFSKSYQDLESSIAKAREKF
jgi:hypothetical protein